MGAPRFLFYAVNGLGLGHVTRLLSIARALEAAVSRGGGALPHLVRGGPRHLPRGLRGGEAAVEDDPRALRPAQGQLPQAGADA